MAVEQFFELHVTLISASETAAPADRAALAEKLRLHLLEDVLFVPDTDSGPIYAVADVHEAEYDDEF